MKRHNSVGEGCTAERNTIRRASVYRNGYNAVADISLPVLGNYFCSVYNTENWTYRRTCAVGVIAAVYCSDKRLFKVAFTVKKSDYSVRYVCRCLEPAEVLVSERHVGNYITCLTPCLSCVIRLKHGSDKFMETAVLGYFWKTYVYKRAYVAYDKSRTFHCRNKYRSICTVALAVVYAGIHIAVAYCFLNKSRVKACPYFSTYPCAVWVLPLIFVFAGKRRNKSSCHVCLSDTVFVPKRRNIFLPVFAEQSFVYIRTVFFYCKQPYELQIEVVVRQRIAGLWVESFDVKNFSFAFKRRTHSAADVFSKPACIDFISEFSSVKLYHNAFFLSDTYDTSRYHI